ASKLMQELNKKMYEEEFRDEVVHLYEEQMKRLHDQFVSSTSSGRGDVSQLSDTVAEFVRVTNAELQQGFNGRVDEALDSLGHYGALIGGPEGAARPLGKFATDTIQAARKVGDFIRVQSPDLKKQERAEGRAWEGAGANPMTHLINAMLEAGGSDQVEIVQRISNTILGMATPGMATRGDTTQFLDALTEAMAKIQAYETIASKLSNLSKMKLSKPVGDTNEYNIRRNAVISLLDTQRVSDTMIESMMNYLAEMDWAKEYLNTNKPEADKLADQIKLFEEFQQQRLGMAKASNTYTMEQYVALWSLVNGIWVEVFVKNAVDKEVFKNHIIGSRTILAAEATSRMLTNYYIKKVGATALKLSPKEAKMLEKYNDRTNRVVDFMAEESAWYEILKKIEERMEEMRKEKSKSMAAPMGATKG
ncbi:MAG: hypothetical protein KGH66_02275, partial [Candidatus Micrarchaeota archaeon]|nr:hypothetical protein [Candidatus Micrarchaeota archaeon]